MSRILVIKHGALGDIVLAFPAFAAIRAAHPAAQITLLTTAPYAKFLAASPWFDQIEIDARPGLTNPIGLFKLHRQLRGFAMVYDLQTSARSSRYFALAGRPPFSGIATGCAYRHANLARNTMHTRERLADQLAAAGILQLPPPDLSWLTANTVKFSLPQNFALLVPGASPRRPEKRWPEQNFAALARALPQPVVIAGGAGESTPAIKATSPSALDLTGQTSLTELAAVARQSSMAIGNDTGPMHLAAALGIPCVVLFGGASDAALTAPRYPDGAWPVILHNPNLASLTVAQVIASLP